MSKFLKKCEKFNIVVDKFESLAAKETTSPSNHIENIHRMIHYMAVITQDDFRNEQVTTN